MRKLFRHTTSFKAIGLLLYSLLAMSRILHATEEPYVNELKGTQVAANSILTVSDEKFNSSGTWSQISQNISVYNIVTFEINYDTAVYFYSTPFSRTINFKIYLYGNQSDTSQVTDSTTHANISLTVHHDTTTGKAYKGIAMYKFTGSHKYKIRILSVTSPGSTPPPVFRLKSQIIVNRKYNFSDNSSDVTRFTVVNTNQLKLEWTPSNYPGAEMFDLEYSYIDGRSQIAGSITSYHSSGTYNVPVDSLEKWFVNNSTRITTAASSYLLNIPYDSGFVLFRIRGVQISYPDELRWEGNWNYYARPSAASSCTPPSCPRGVVLFDGHEKNLNWQLSISFAEEGKRKEVISYFDGSLRNRQSVTLSNTDNRNIVQETIYDALGRPAASILPAPANDSTIHYFRGFNRNSGGTNPYSFTDLSYANCVSTADSVSYASGTGKYYSTSNPWLGSYYYAKYIPNAGGYPLAVTEYMADNTGRIKAQGGVGPAFQLGSGHETKYYYGKPKQAELDRLFGAEAGNASHYLKNMVMDANGQVSVSYLDASGKTVATALAGAVPSNLDTISSQGSSLDIVDVLLQPADFIRNPTDQSIYGSTTLLVPVSGTYKFRYEMASLRYNKLFGPNKDTLLCSSCYYDMELTIKNNCDSVLLRDTIAAGNVFDTACTSSLLMDSSTITISQIGEYYIHYNLKISQDAMVYFDSVHLAKNSDIRKINSFLLEELKKEDFYGCYSDCNTCFDKLGTKPDFVNLFRSLYAADSLQFVAADSTWAAVLYDSLYVSCQAKQSGCNTGNVCDEKLVLLKMDVSPGGQYALYDSNYVLQEVPINVLAQRSQLAWFPSETGARDSVTLKDINGEDSIRVDVKSLNDTLFIHHWKSSWADSLVKLHPEYCYYLWCSANSSSFEFDQNIENWSNGDSVMAKGWFYPPVYDTIMTYDPFFLIGGNGYALRNRMKDSLRLFSRTLIRFADKDKNILQVIDMMLYCKNSESCNIWNTCSPDNDCRSRSREWALYKQYYLNLKQRFYEEARRTSANPVFANCSNCFIGSDIASGILTCADTGDFSFQCEGEEVTPYCKVIYKNGKQPGVSRKTFVTVRVKANSSAYTFTEQYVFNIGDTVLGHYYEAYHIDSILSVTCDTTTWQPFTDTLCNPVVCEYGTYNPYDRDSVSFYITGGNPDTAPSGVPGGYSGCQFYNVFTVYTGPSSSCRFLNVWVCVKDSTCPGGSGVCYGTNYPSTCVATGNDTLYENKMRRYATYLDPAEIVNSMLADNPQQGSEEMHAVILEQCAINCEAQADYWISKLSRCHPNPAYLAALKTHLINICTLGCSTDRPFGASTIPNSITYTYHSFEEAIAAIIGSVSDSCTTELLALPYPYNRQPIFADRAISETDSAICATLAAKQTAYSGSGFSGSFHRYLQTVYGEAYHLDSLELNDMINACEECNHILKNDMILPVIFDPASAGCIDCDSISAAMDDFETKFPILTTTNDDYEVLFTNYFNHRFGFALSFDEYKNFIDSCTANSGSYSVPLCNKPVSTDIVPDDNACLRDLYTTALSNAGFRFITYIDSVRRDFREAWLTQCMNAQPKLSTESTVREYHYTLYYYDQSGNLLKTIPPEGVALLSKSNIETLQAVRAGINPQCSNNNAALFTNGTVNFPGGTNATQLNVGADPFTIETWINLSSLSNQGILSNTYSIGFGGGGGGTNATGYSLSVNSSKLLFRLGEIISGFKVEAETPALSGFISLNTWNHIAVQRTSINSVKIFINGNEVPVSYITNNPSTGNLNYSVAGTFYVGGSNWGGTLSKLSSGKLRHVRIYTRALPAAEIRQNFMDHCGNPANASAMVFWEPLNEGAWTASGGNDYLYERTYAAAGQKSGTVSFETSLSTSLVPAHRLATTYQYNSLNQVLQQYSPDGDTSWFFYDRLGRLTASQNKEQKDNSSYSGTANRFSYTLYDSLGRITEVGEKGSVSDIRSINMLKADSVTYWLGLGTNRQLTKTIYDNPVNANLQDQNTSRKRVAASIYLEYSSDAIGDSTLYNYDILGNVKMLLQHVKTLVAADVANGRKRIDYEYDLVSGKVNLVSYQHGKGDQFYYKYAYDADNRVTRSYSSRDKLVWREDGSYNYYLHGPLARTELGHNKVQGVDYSYTLQGWLKGINSDSLSSLYDMAQDGRQNTDYARVSRDVYGFKIGYYNNDYTAIGGSGADAFSKKVYSAPGSFAASGNPLYNGNISYTTLALSKLNTGAATGYSYGYDQLNRLVEMRQHTTGTSSGWSNTDIITAYRESVSYDANGNILQYLRKGTAATLHMDSLTYKYNRDGSGNLTNNRLNHVRDSIPSGNYSVDIDNQSANNYTYDKIGNLIEDDAEGIEQIYWNVYGKIKYIGKNSGYNAIYYGYDAGGHRTSKYKISVLSKEPEAIDSTSTWYIRDAQGNVLAVYERGSFVIEEAGPVYSITPGPLIWKEQHLYGSSRLGMWHPDTTVASNPPMPVSGPVYDSIMIGSRSYELVNHLGNVLSTISDKKIGNDSSGAVNYYIAEVLSQNDYYPFGMLQPGRSFAAGTGYGYGFNGKENDNEVKGEGNQQDYGLRIYDPRLGRFLSIDPLRSSYPWYSPYQFAGNKPIRYIDRDGAEEDDPDKYYRSALPKIYLTFAQNLLKLPESQQSIVSNALDYARKKRNTFDFWGRWLSARLMTRWAEGKGGYDILSYSAVSSVTVKGTIKDVRKELLSKVKEHVASLKEEGTYSYTASSQSDRSGSYAQVLISDVASALGSFKILGRVDAYISIDKKGNSTVIMDIYYTLADKYQWKSGRGIKEGDFVDHNTMLQLEKIGAKPFYIRSYFEETYRGKNGNFSKSGNTRDSVSDLMGSGELKNPEPKDTNGYSIPSGEKKKVNDSRGG